MVKISLPHPHNFIHKGGIKQFLRQLELSVHHAKKAYDEMEKDGLIDEENSSFITFRHPRMNLDERESDDKGFVKVHVDDEGDAMNEIEIEIAI